MKIINHRLVADEGAPEILFQEANAFGGIITPRFLIMHYTAGGSGRATAHYFSAPTTKTSAHFIIDRDGTIIQQVPCNRKAYHAGRSQWQGTNGLNTHSIGIELANWGLLNRDEEGYRSHTGQPVPDTNVIMAAHRNGSGINAWERFPDPQIHAAIAVASAICTAYGIGSEAILGHDDIAPGRKIDPGAAFPMDAFRVTIFRYFT